MVESVTTGQKNGQMTNGKHYISILYVYIYQKEYARFGYVLQIKFSGQSRFIIEILNGCGPERSLGAAAALRCHVVTTQKCRIRFN